MRGHRCYSLANNLTAFGSSPETSGVAEFQSNELICLAEESSKQYTLQVMVWLLLTVCSQIERQRKREKERATEQLAMYSRGKDPCTEGSNL